MSKASWEVACLLKKLECRIYTLCVMDLIPSLSCQDLWILELSYNIYWSPGSDSRLVSSLSAEELWI